MADRVSTATINQANFDRQRQVIRETDFVLNFLEKAEQYRQPLVTVWREIEENRLVASPSARNSDAVPFIGSSNYATVATLQQRQNPRWRNRSLLKDPESSQIADTNLAQAITLLMSSPDYLTAIPIGADDPEKARYLSRLLMAILQSPGNYRTIFEAIDSAFTYGAGIVQIGWETKSRMQTILRPVIDPDTGMVIGRESDVAEVVYRDAPLMQNVDRFDVWTDPSGTRIQENMLGICKRFRTSTSQALQLVEAGVYKREPTMRAIRAAAGKGKDSDEEYERRLRNVEIDTATEYGMLTGFEFWGESPVSQPRNRVITLLEGEHVRSTLNMFIDGCIPFHELVPNPIPGRFDGLSPLEAIRFLQDAADAQLMGLTDAYDLAYRNVLLMGNSWGGNPERLQDRRPNDIIRCTDPTAVVPLPFDSGSLIHATNHYAMLNKRQREASGSLDPLRDAPDRATATHVSEVVKLASAKTEMSVQLIERNDFPWIGKTLHARMRQFLSPERQSILAGEQFPVTLDEIDFEADVRFVGSRQATSKFQKQAAMQQAIQVLGTNPEVLRTVPKLILRWMRDGLNIQDSEEIIAEAIQELTRKEQVQIQQQQQLEAAKGQSVPNASGEASFGTEVGETEREGQRVA